MTLSSAVVKRLYDGDGATTSFAIDYIFWDVDDIKVTHTDSAGVETVWTRGTQYNITRDIPTGATTGTLNVVTTPTDYTPASGEKLTVASALTDTQDTALPLGGALPSATIEQELDQIVRLVQQKEEQLSRVLKYPDSEATTTSGTLPALTTRVSKFLAFDSGGEPIAASGTSADLTPVSAFINTLLDDVDADTLIESIASGATAETALATDDIILISDTSATSGRKMSISNVLKIINTLTADATPDANADYLLTYDADAATTKRVLISNLFTNGFGPAHSNNVGFTSTVASLANTISLTGRDLSSPSATNSVDVAFQNATATTGDYAVVRTQAATSITIPNGATLGFTASEDGYVYIYGINNAGTVELAVAKKALWSDNQLVSTTVLDTSSDSDSVMYSATARSNVAVRLLGRQRITANATPGEWGSAPTELVVWEPTMSKTGDVVQYIPFVDGAVASGTALIPADDTIPQISEGDQYMSASITPTSTINKLRIEICANLSSTGTSGTFIGALFQDLTADSLAATWAGRESAAGNVAQLSLNHDMAAGTTSSTTFKFRAGSVSGSATTTFNGASATRRLGGVFSSRLDIWEIQA